MAKKSRKASKSRSERTRRAANQRNVRSGFTAMASGLVDMAFGVGPEFTALPTVVHNHFKKLFAGKKVPLLKVCGSSMAAKFLIVRLPGPKR